MARLPFMQWYPNDWMADPAVRSCSIAARGLWIDLLSLMHLSPRRGYLLAATGLPLSLEQIARLTGCSTDEATRLLAELRSSGVFSCTDDGVIYSRRMVRDETKREKCTAAGKRGGNPTLKGHPNLPEARSQKPEARSNPPNPPSGGSRPTIRGDPASVPIPARIDTPEVRTAWEDWIAERAARRKPLTERAARLALDQLADLTPAQVVECIRLSIANGWQGLFPERFRGGAGPGRAPAPTKAQAQDAYLARMMADCLPSEEVPDV
jgi:hypothetical protein